VINVIFTTRLSTEIMKAPSAKLKLKIREPKKKMSLMTKKNGEQDACAAVPSRHVFCTDQVSDEAWPQHGRALPKP
jgi:hypothetical protein